MKVTTLILATYILLLTFQPMLSVFAVLKNNETVDCCSNKSCENEQSDKKSNKSEQHKQCNPFQICSLCCGYAISEFSLKHRILKQFMFSKIIYIESKKSIFSASFFQPPEII